MVEPEMAFCDIRGNMDLAEVFLKHVFKFVLETCPEDMSFSTSGLIILYWQLITSSTASLSD